MKVTGFSASVVSVSYQFSRSPETVAEIARGFAELYGFNAARLVRLFQGREDAPLHELLELELRKMRCTGEGPHLESVAGLQAGWYDPLVDEGLIVPKLRLCKACVRRKAPRVGDSWAAQLKRNAARLPAAIVQAIDALEESGRTITYKGLEEKSGMPLREIRKTLAQAGLEKEREGRKNFGRYLIWIGITIWSLIPAKGEAATVGETADRQIPEYILSAVFAALLERLRRGTRADRLRQYLAGLAGTGCSGAPALGAA